MHLASISVWYLWILEKLWWLCGKEPACQCRRCGFNPWVGKVPGVRNGNPFQYSCLENFMDRGAWQITVHGVTELDMTEFQKNIYFCFIDYTKAFDCVDHKKLWKILKEMGIPDHLICLWRNLYAGQEATVRTGHGTTDWFKIGKGIRQGCILSPCLFNFYAEYIMTNTGLEETQAGIKIAGRNINNLRYADDTTLMAESEEELKSLLMKVKCKVKKWAQSSTFRKQRSWHPVPPLHGK